MEDTIFLLSRDEYLRYREFIPQLNFNWWLRSPSNCVGADYVVFVLRDGSPNVARVNNPYIWVRPALRLDKVKIKVYENIFVYCGITWVKIDKNIAISELPISLQIFNKDKSNNYEKSDIRSYILNWLEKRKNY
ncbi:MAG: hypothetical protein Q4D29_13575 [Lachnospiraceae bacterium]|nr:hypothetical protein [Lachnospiraceae bacterium]